MAHRFYTVQKTSTVMQPALVRHPLAPSLSQTPLEVAQDPVVLECRLITHRISAGFPSPAADYSEEGLDLNDYLVRNKPATFMFTVRGDSMIGASIEEGDKVIVDRAMTPKHDDIVVAVVDGEYTIKRLYKHQGRVELQPENPAYSPIVLSDGIELLVWGVVVGVVRRYPSRG
jgi:DNA polymerase V